MGVVDEADGAVTTEADVVVGVVITAMEAVGRTRAGERIEATSSLPSRRFNRVSARTECMLYVVDIHPDVPSLDRI